MNDARDRLSKEYRSGKVATDYVLDHRGTANRRTRAIATARAR